MTIALLCALFSKTAPAQSVSSLTDEQVQQFVQQAQASGMADGQMEALAISRGFTPIDINRMRQRISQLRPAANKSAATAETNVVREQPPLLSRQSYLFQLLRLFLARRYLPILTYRLNRICVFQPPVIILSAPTMSL
ncbi:hypothetical protein [Spirosoma sp. KNUC1025]|uniref:hypothetical protein n=1 Tax=Spirosoma sp. KNUC1025 TaxID=2894082 RepID=UPI00386F795D|nr:hypothetical protein LN737_04425 [Spirosoma sp. KNUC1025]